MVDMIDLLQCPVCGTFYKPEVTATGRTIPHCWPGVTTGRWFGRRVKGLNRHVEALAIQPVETDFSVIEARVVEGYRLTGGVVDPPLTGLFLDVKV